MTAGVNHSLPKRIALGLLRCYPRPWRARYLEEMHALLEEIPVGWKQTANIAAVAVREWLSPRALGWPARTAAGRVLALRGLLFVASACALDGMARLAAWRLHEAGVTAIGWLEDAGAVLFLIVVLRLASTFGFRPDRMRSRRWRQTLPWWRRPLSGPEVLLCGILLLPMMLEHHVNPFEGWESAYTRTIDPYMHVMRLWLYAYMLHQASSRGWRLRRIQWTKLPSTKAGTTVS